MQMNRREIQALLNESERFIDKSIYFKITLAGDLSVLRMCVFAGSLFPMPEKSQGFKDQRAEMYEMRKADSPCGTGTLS